MLSKEKKQRLYELFEEGAALGAAMKWNTERGLPYPEALKEALKKNKEEVMPLFEDDMKTEGVDGDTASQE